MEFRKTLILSLIISLSLSGFILYLSSKDIPPYKYELKYAENPDTLLIMIANDSSLNRAIHNYAIQHQQSYSKQLQIAINSCNAQRVQILKSNFYSSKVRAEELQISHNSYINKMCIDSLRKDYK